MTRRVNPPTAAVAITRICPCSAAMSEAENTDTMLTFPWVTFCCQNYFTTQYMLENMVTDTKTPHHICSSLGTQDANPKERLKIEVITLSITLSSILQIYQENGGILSTSCLMIMYCKIKSASGLKDFIQLLINCLKHFGQQARFYTLFWSLLPQSGKVV